MIPIVKFLLPLVLVLFFSNPAFPQIYQWKDKNGNMVFSDTPPQGNDSKKVKVLKERGGPSPQEQVGTKGQDGKVFAHPPETKKGKREYRDIQVSLYMTEWCPYSLKARAYLKSLGVNLTEYDVERDASRNEEKMRKSGEKGVPVIDVEGIIVKGFNENGIKQAVEKRREFVRAESSL